jgi:hypothetical protein
MAILNVLFGLALIIGIIVLLGIFFAVIGTIVLFVIFLIYQKTKKIIFPKLTLILIYLFEGFLKSLFMLLGLKKELVALFIIDVFNKYFYDKFKKTKKRILFLPQCLRSAQCPAPATPYGIRCLKCGKCKIKDIIEFAEKLGYKVCVATGGTMVKRVMAKEKPEGVVGVGCIFEVKEGLELCHLYGIPAQGVILSKDGCVETDVDVNELYRVLEIGLIDKENKSNSDKDSNH